MVLRTDLLATIALRLARLFAAKYPLRILTPPLELPRPALRQVWHVRSAEDPGTVLLRRLVRDEATRGARLP